MNIVYGDMIEGVNIGFLEGIAPFGAWVAAFFALLAWISPTLYRKYRNYKIKKRCVHIGIGIVGSSRF